eukprot:11755642-Alexandrium_andersonii.AAC.1
MSASLVGSEMCIRDRPSADAAGGSRLQAVLQPRGSSAAKGEWQEKWATCLLYTSDAADDM